MFSKILIANRGEIACRIIKACNEMGIKTVAIYSDVDSNALHTILADEAISIGGNSASESYLNIDKVINAALQSNADAIHPGYGFLSENHHFNEKVRESGLTFIGPDPEPMRLLGSKVESRIKMIEAGVPVVPGLKNASTNINEYITEANKIGYPVLIKASAGGGGKGMRVVWTENELEESINSAMREALSAFGDDTIFMEKYILEPRHIEIQVARDKFGNSVHLFERECSIQRRHQKVIEETPSMAIDDVIRHKMGDAAIKALDSVNYHTVATVEFLLDKDKNFYFLEVNTRIQVEHAITEMVTGIDLVKLQINLAFGNPIGLKQEDIKQNGHAIETRIYAENAENNFLPTGGKVLNINELSNPGIRIDTGIKIGDEISSYYDPIMSKIICFGSTREESIQKSIYALKNYNLLGVVTSIPFLLNILGHQDFRDAKTTTDFIVKRNDELLKFNDHSIEAMSILDKLGISNNKQNIVNNTHLSSPWLEIGKWEID